MTPEQLKTQEQVRLAETGQAEGQCADCGSYRSDGKPPILHRSGCPHEADYREEWKP